MPIRRFVSGLLCSAVTASLVFCFAMPAAAGELKPGVRGVATRAPAPMKIDGNLAEYKEAFCTPAGYFERDVENRAAQVFYMWDDEAFYVGLRTLDKKQANYAKGDLLFDGDGMEWYFDTRRGDDFRSTSWGKGAVHLYFTAYDELAIKPRWVLRRGFGQAIPSTGVQIGGGKTDHGAQTEFKLPWANFPGFKPAVGEVIGLDAEVCYSDGGARTARTFAYGSPLSVTQPASQAAVQLVERLQKEHWKQCGPVMTPVRCDTEWDQKTRPMVTGLMALPPNHVQQIGKVVFRLLDTQGKTIGDFAGRTETVQADGNFTRSRAMWTSEVAEPGTFLLVAIVYDPQGNELARVAPRMVSVGNTPGY